MISESYTKLRNKVREILFESFQEDNEIILEFDKLKKNAKLIELIGEDYDWRESINEAEYRGRKVKLNKPFRTSGGPKKFSVYVKNKKGNVVKVNFGDPNLRVKNYNPKRAKSFRARHKCDTKKDRTTPGYWSCNISRYKKALGLKSSRTW
jgi:hypothetical protein